MKGTSRNKNERKKETLSSTWAITKRILKTLGMYMLKVFTYSMNVLLTVMLIGIVAGSIMAAALAIYCNENIDAYFEIQDLQLDLDETTTLYYQNDAGEWIELEEDRLYGEENRLWISYDRIPSNLYQAFVAIEDKRFFTHSGVDFRRTLGAFLGFAAGTTSYGGSTITQQLIKNITHEDDTTIQRKMQEILRALDFETRKTKEEILEMYLNTIYLSQGCYGVQTASAKYFNKDVSELSLVECAAIAAIPQYPTRWDPIQNPAGNKERRDVILKEMFTQGIITKEDYEEAKNTELVLATEGQEQTTSTVHSYYIDTVISDVMKDLQKELGYTETMAYRMLYSGGLKIYTCLKPNVQNALEDVYESALETIYAAEKKKIPDAGVAPQSAISVVDNSTGYLVGVVGGIGKKETARGLNRATQSTRQPGSSIKPISIYSIALEKGVISFGSSVDDTPALYKNGSPYPRNSNTTGTFSGRNTVVQAVKSSFNTIPMKLLIEMTPEYIYEFMTTKYHFSTLVYNEVTPTGRVVSDLGLSSLSLGGLTYGVTTREMTQAYATFPNNGTFREAISYQYIETKDGEILISNMPETEQILSEETAFSMNELLKGVVSGGTGSKASPTLKKEMNNQMAGKTGTTNDSKDLYFSGYTPYYTAAVWFGYDKPKSLGRFSTSPALTLWSKCMDAIHQPIIDSTAKKDRLTFASMSNMVKCKICKVSGLKATAACELDPRGSQVTQSYFMVSKQPKTECNMHVQVKWCTVSKSVAGPDCPEETCKVISLVKLNVTDRYFETNIKVNDAQYIYMTVPENYVYPTDTTKAFFINLYPSNRYPGYSINTTRPVNSFCVEHNQSLTADNGSYKRPTDVKDNKNAPSQTTAGG